MSKQAESRRSRIKELQGRIFRLNAVEDDLKQRIGNYESNKQKFLEELQGICPHDRVLEFTEVRWKDPGEKTLELGTMRVCADCNLVEATTYLKLSAAPVRSVPYKDMHRYAVLGRKLSA